jgi:hypothetical protein
MHSTLDTTQIPMELDRRENHGIAVSLLWQPATGIVTVAVNDDLTGDAFELVVPSDQALDAFHHPYAYAASGAVSTTIGALEPVAA